MFSNVWQANRRSSFLSLKIPRTDSFLESTSNSQASTRNLFRGFKREASWNLLPNRWGVIDRSINQHYTLKPTSFLAHYIIKDSHFNHCTLDPIHKDFNAWMHSQNVIDVFIFLGQQIFYIKASFQWEDKLISYHL